MHTTSTFMYLEASYYSDTLNLHSSLRVGNQVSHLQKTKHKFTFNAVSAKRINNRPTDADKSFNTSDNTYKKFMKNFCRKTSRLRSSGATAHYLSVLHFLPLERLFPRYAPGLPCAHDTGRVHCTRYTPIQHSDLTHKCCSTSYWCHWKTSSPLWGWLPLQRHCINYSGYTTSDGTWR
jgi:hypothetical protein